MGALNDTAIEDSYILYIEANNLYGFAMSQVLPKKQLRVVELGRGSRRRNCVHQLQQNDSTRLLRHAGTSSKKAGARLIRKLTT